MVGGQRKGMYVTLTIGCLQCIKINKLNIASKLWLPGILTTSIS